MACRSTCGLSVPQFRALALLSRNPTASLSMVAEHLGSSQPGASRLILAVSPERVASAIVKSAQDGSFRRIIPASAGMFIALKEHFPRAMHALFRAVSSMLERRR